MESQLFGGSGGGLSPNPPPPQEENSIAAAAMSALAIRLMVMGPPLFLDVARTIPVCTASPHGFMIHP
jgi:hypothetical protein